MALPTKSQVQTLDFTDWSLPICWVDAKASVDSSTLDYTAWSLPVVALSAGAAPADPTNVVYVNINGTWQTATNVYVNVSGTWQEGVVSIKTASGWNS